MRILETLAARRRRGRDASTYTRRLVGVLGATLAVAVACNRGDDRRDDGALRSDSAAAMSGAVAADDDVRGDLAFTRRMADHHMQLLQFLDTIDYRLRLPQAQQDAIALRLKQANEHQQLIARLGMAGTGGTGAGATPRDSAMTEGGRTQGEPRQSIRDRDGGAVDKGPRVDGAFYDFVIQHHRAGLRMVDAALPTLTDPQLKAMATKMRGDHEREIAEFERKRASIKS